MMMYYRLKMKIFAEFIIFNICLSNISNFTTLHYVSNLQVFATSLGKFKKTKILLILQVVQNDIVQH